MPKEVREKLFAEVHQKRLLCADWLKTLMLPGVPKPATKDELFRWARDNLGVSRSAFDAGRIWAIEDMGRHDWHEASPRRKGDRN